MALSDRDWLVTLEIAGRTLRYASHERLVDDELYEGGLDASLRLTETYDDDVTISIVSPSLYEVAELIDTGTATVSLVDESGAVTVFRSGLLAAPQWGNVEEPVTCSITRDIASSTRGRQLPAETAAVIDDTWPITGEIGAEGVHYPIIFGYPGWRGSGNPVPVVPCPIAQWTSGSALNTLAIVCEDAVADIDLVRVKVQDDHSQDNQPCDIVTDLLGQRVIACDFSAFGSTVPADPTAGILVGYKPDTGSGGGGGRYRSLYDCIVYVLARWGKDSTDFSRLPLVAPLIEAYNVDSYVIETVQDPWVLVEHWVQPLNLIARTSSRGKYLVAQRYQHDPLRVVRELVNPVRVSGFTREGPPENEVRVRYRPDPEVGLRAQVLIVGSKEELRPAAVTPNPRHTIETAIARRSYSRYGRRPGSQLELDWTWDTGTAIAVGEAVLARTALPCRMVTYELDPPEARGLQEGDEVLVTDDTVGLVSQPGILSEPPTVALDSVSITLRIPQ